MPRRTQPDLCQMRIVNKLREIGVSVVDAHEVGKGFTDLVLGWRGKSHIMEVKSRSTPRWESQVAFAQEWHGELSLLREMGDEYMLTCWRDGLHLFTKQFADIGAVMNAVDNPDEFAEIPMINCDELEEGEANGCDNES